MLDAWVDTRRGCVSLVGQEGNSLPQDNPSMLKSC